MNISTIIITKNEQKMLQNCINSVRSISNEIIVVDHDSTDRTREIAQLNNCKIIQSSDPSFANRRSLGLSAATGDWILYLDADERVTPELAAEIAQLADHSHVETNYIINRRDYYFGTQWPSLSPMHRLFLRTAITGWQGVLHETPVVTGETGTLQNELIHLTHTDIDSMLTNTQRWSTHEAELRFKANHPPIVWWRLIRVFLSAWWHSFVTQKGYSKGTVGWIESIYQGCSMFLTYAKLWEMQNQTEITNSYAAIEQSFLQTTQTDSSPVAP